MLKKVGLSFYVLPVIMFAILSWNPAYSLLLGTTIDTITALRAVLIHSAFLGLLAFTIHYEKEYAKLIYARLAITIFSAFFLAGFLVGPILLIIDAIRVLRHEKAKKY